MSVVVPDPAITNWVPLGYGATIQTNVPSCKAKKNTAFSCPTSAFTPVPLDQMLWDTDNMYASGSSRLTCRTAGRYMVVGDATFTPNAAGAHRLASITQNGALISTGGVVSGSAGSGAQRANVAAEVLLAVGDYIELNLYQDTGTANSASSDLGGGPVIAATYIGPGLLGRGIQNISGTYLTRPAANAVPAGSTYFCTDTLGTFLSDGAAWTLVNQRAPIITSAQMSAAPFSTPYDGQEIVLIDATPTYVWHLRYNANDGSAFKWYFVGGAPLSAYDGSTDSGTGTVTWVGNKSPSLVAPRAGVYHVLQKLDWTSAAATGTLYLAVDKSSAPNVSAYTASSGGQGTTAAGTQMAVVHTGDVQLAASEALRTMVYLAVAGSFYNRLLEMTPKRLA